MNDPDETANLVEPLLGAWRERMAGIRAERPLSLEAAVAGNIADQIDRYAELTDRELGARSIEILQDRGEYTEQKARILPVGKYQPLTLAEYLEMLALGERIARYYRHPSQVDSAVKAGATWEQIAAATGTTEDAARGAYREWADGQHRLHADLDKFGLDEDEYAAALEAAERPADGGQP